MRLAVGAIAEPYSIDSHYIFEDPHINCYINSRYRIKPFIDLVFLNQMKLKLVSK